MARTHEQLIKKFDRSDRFGRLFLYIALSMIVLLSFSTFVLQTKSREAAAGDRKRLEEQGADIKLLSEQNKKLAEDNIFLNDRLIFYSKCQTRLFVRWTQNFPAPIKLDKLPKCEFTVKGDGSFRQDFNPTLNDERNPQSSKPTSTTEPNTKPTATQPEPQEPVPAPPQSILPGVDDPILLCINRLCL